MSRALRIAAIALALVALVTPTAFAQDQTSPAGAPAAGAPAAGAPAAGAAQAAMPTLENPSPELVNHLTQKLSISPAQAIGGAGALFGLAKTRLSPEDFGKVSSAVPGMDGLLKAAPSLPSPGGALPSAAMGSVSSSLPAGTALPADAGGLAPVAASFKSLGLSPDMAAKMVPILTHFVSRGGGVNAGSILAGAFK